MLLRCAIIALLLQLTCLPLFGFAAAGQELGKVEMYMSQGRADKALAFLDTIIAANPERIDAYSSRAFIYLKLNRHQQAIADFSHIIGLQPDDPSAYLSRGLVYDQLHETERAAADYRHACTLGGKAGCSFLEQLKSRSQQ
ncbi:tetratricopeptide repeat protein [Geobacter pelophilus]|uniref:Tetratricopeptide repeat protein n=1 Tax=Geoanaerobacter pelophilus TaxID=60036 RepID=A0AAW4LFM9_9BACT|nr:tetratricopeptide repeat protein [Geoanaerobacter pelophilus]MBT0665981.1 tetratricopeptide repeat protein [Geoanaerobacter pelophilus]